MLPSTQSTVANYDGRISSFSSWAFGSEALAAQNIRAKFIDKLTRSNFNGGTIVDVGCGPGRDLDGFLDAGYDVVGLEPSALFCRTASDFLVSKHSVERFSIVQGDICDSSVVQNIKLKDQQIVGTFCLASLFHIPYSKLTGALNNIKSLLVHRGLILSSFPLREDSTRESEGMIMPDGRWATGLSERQHFELLTTNDFTVLDSFVCHIYNGVWGCIIAQLN